MAKKSNIALIGFMGVGKSAVGKILAEKLRKKLVETDALAEERPANTLPKFFPGRG